MNNIQFLLLVVLSYGFGLNSMDNSEGEKYKHLVPISSFSSMAPYCDKIVAFDTNAGSFRAPRKPEPVMFVGFREQNLYERELVSIEIEKALALRYAYVTKKIDNITWQEDGCYLCEYVDDFATDNLIPITNGFLKKMGLRIRLATNDEKKC